MSKTAKTMLEPGPEPMQRVNQTFLDYGYSGLSMVTMAKACGFTKLNGYFTAAEISQALADGGRAVNQVLPPIASEDFQRRYRRMCEVILYGCAAMPKQKSPKR